MAGRMFLFLKHEVHLSPDTLSASSPLTTTQAENVPTTSLRAKSFCRGVLQYERGYRDLMRLPADSPDNVHSSVPVGEKLASFPAEEIHLDLSPTPDGDMTEITLPQARTDLDQQRKTLQKSPATEPLPGKEPYFNRRSWQNWYSALKSILPIYISVHLALFAISCLAFLFLTQDFSKQVMPISTLWEQWYHWDTAHFIKITLHGYYNLLHMAFFPLYPLLERTGMVVTGDPFTAGLLLSNVAELVLFTVLYRLVKEDFGGDRAYHTLFYLAIFPTAFFFSIAYSESLFLCLSTLTFYQLRRGRWWQAGLCGFLATLTRPDGLFLLIPFCYEYLCRLRERQDGIFKDGSPTSGEQEPEAKLRLYAGGTVEARLDRSRPAIFSREQLFGLLKSIRFDVLCGLCMPMSIVLFMIYGWLQFHDPLAFVHAHKAWNRYFHVPGWGVLKSLYVMLHNGLLSFLTLRNALDLGTDLLMFVLIMLSFVGPWRLPKRLWGYSLYAATLFLYFQAFPRTGSTPLESMSRFLLELFPLFIILAGMRKNRTLHLGYCMLAGTLLFFLATQFATNHWVL